MTGAVLWYLWILAAGLVVFPFAWRIMRFLPDRGWTLSKAFGLLLWGYGLWLGASLRVLPNQTGGWLVSLLILAGISIWTMRKGGWRELRTWLATRRKVIFTAEILFMLAFALWTVVRAANPDLSSTEKPMELAFINAILRSPAFPPHDPWLAGYGISYYYFGYVIVAMLSGLSGVSGSAGFSLGVATSFGLGALGIYGVVFNLLAAEPRRKSAHFAALLAPLFLLLLGNLEGPLELLHNSGAFWKTQANGQLDSEFWRWLDIRDLKEPPAATFNFWEENGRRSWWWWRASRVISDYDASAGWEAVTDPGITGGWREVIDEFPAFSFALGDLHPHVLSIPYVLLAIGLAFNRYKRELEEETGPQGWRQWIKQPEFWILAVCLGGLSFLNTWDFPIYVALTAAAYGLVQVKRQGWGVKPILSALAFALAIGLAGIALYLPFYLGFASQAGGILPSLSYYSRGVHWWVMFGVLLIPILFWLGSTWRAALDRKTIKIGLTAAVILVGGLWLLSYAWGALMLALPEQGNLLTGIQASNDAGSILLTSFLRRLAQPGTWLSLLALLTMVVGLLWRQGEKRADQPDSSSTGPDGFVLLLVLLGAGLTLFPEFFYLRDQFGWRMNTIFKFFYQTWILWAVAAAYGSVWLWENMPGWQRALMRLVWVAVVAGGLVYPAFAFFDRANGFKPVLWTLDGADIRALNQPQDMEAIAWLKTAPYGVVAEAVGGSYSEYARVATYSGLPAVLGWPGHEGQWRGGYGEVGSRQEDIGLLYSARRWEDAEPILLRYNIRYVYVGGLELSTYAVLEEKFINYMELVFQNDGVRIYERVLP
jgi:YYY domain-containing protein